MGLPALLASVLRPLARGGSDRFDSVLHGTHYLACRSATQTSRLSPKNVALSRATALPSPTVGFRFEMKHLPDDLLRIILAFASPTVGARQLAARARTLDEEVEFRPSNEPENYPSDWKIVEKAVAHTHEQLDLLNALRAVSTGFRNLISYGSTRQLCTATSPRA